MLRLHIHFLPFWMSATYRRWLHCRLFGKVCWLHLQNFQRLFLSLKLCTAAINVSTTPGPPNGVGRPMSTTQGHVMIPTVYHEANSNAWARSLIIKHVMGVRILPTSTLNSFILYIWLPAECYSESVYNCPQKHQFANKTAIKTAASGRKHPKWRKISATYGTLRASTEPGSE
jgi:hypothetical protein